MKAGRSRSWFTLIILLLLVGLGSGLVLLTGCQKREGEETSKPGAEGLPMIRDKRVVMIIAARNFRDEELQKPKEILERQGARVTIASTNLDEAVGMFGTRIRPEILLKDVIVHDYDAIIFVGGIGATQYWDDPVAHKIAQESVKQDKVLGAICV
jgi:protease I